MATSGSPLVSVVIPVYNGQDTIADAIRSVLAQTYTNFTITIVNNCSTDETGAIAEDFARKDPRIRVHHATEFVSVVESHNRAFTLISDDAVYAKILGADDLLFPNCLAELVPVAENYPTVGMVSSYAVRDSRVVFDGLPLAGPRWSGREAARRFLLDGIYAFGSPSSSLVRASVVREKTPFFNPRVYHGDTDSYLDIMQRYDFGFVHQVLSFERRSRPGGTSAWLERFEFRPAIVLDMVTRYGPIYLTPEEFERRHRQVQRVYYEMLGRAVFRFRGKAFWDYHRHSATALDGGLNAGLIAKHAALYVLEAALNPLETAFRLARWWTARRARQEPVTPPPAFARTAVSVPASSATRPAPSVPANALLR